MTSIIDDNEGKLSKEEQKMIDEAQKAKWDNYAIKQAAIDSGIRQGVLLGRDQMAREIAKKMKVRKVPVEEIAEIVDLSIDEINAL